MKLRSVISAGALTLSALGPVSAADRKFYRDDPVWTMPRPNEVRNPSVRPLSEYYDFFENTLFPGRERSRPKGVFRPSQAVNTVDEVPDSAWYINRHATRRMSLAELKAGPGDSYPPAPGKWTVIAAKIEGITPGLRIRDAAGRQYLVKFDPISNPEMASAADVITSKFFYALGYNVPENYIAVFERGQLSIGTGASMRDAEGRRRPIRESDIDDILAKAPQRADGRYRALASRLIGGKPLGPFQYHGTRGDDPNDLVPHQDRRDLRGLRTLCAWLGHDDSKALNTLDVLVEGEGPPYIKHYLIDFGASLGSATFMANSPRDGNVYLFDWKSSAAQFFSLGMYVPRWQRAKYPNLPAVGRFEYAVFDPERWTPDYPNAAFRNETPADRLWAARKIAAFSDEEIRAIVSTGQYSDPAAAEWVARCLIERRKKILNACLVGTAALDRFEVRDERLRFDGAENAPAVQVQWAAFDNETGRRRVLSGERSMRLPRTDDPAEYLVADLTGPQGPHISVYVNATNKNVVGVERSFAAAREK